MKTRLVSALFFSALVLRAAPAPSTITAVTVYSDRAVVTRSASVEVAAAGPVEVLFERLPTSLLDQSLQVAGRGTAQVTILDVTARAAYVDFTPNERVKSLEDQLREVQKQRRVLEDRTKALNEQAASLGRIESASTQPPAKEAPRLSLEEAAKLLVFLDEQRTKLATEHQSLDVQLEKLTATQTALEQQLKELRNTGQRSFKNVVVRLTAATAGQVEITLSYAVPEARWSPSYDARVASSERSVQLGYFGVVRQRTGEDWKNVNLTLSTARPSLGGSPPALNPWTVDVFRPMPMPAAAELHQRNEIAYGSARAKTSLANAPEEKDAVFQQAQVEAQATSASFRIPVKADIPSDNAPQRVPITTAQLASIPEYLAIPKQRKTAFLTAKVTNSSEFPLLAGAMNVFLDGTFVAQSSLPTVMPGEKFDLALGADEGLAVSRTLNNRFTEDTGIVSKSKRITYDFTLTIQNNKKTTEKIVVQDQVPVSRNEKIVVKVLAPDEKEAKPGADGMIRWTLMLKPGEKRELALKFSIEHPSDLPVAGLE